MDLKTVSATDLSEILRKLFSEVKTEKGQVLTPSALTGIRAAIHGHLTCVPLSRNINILQDSELMSANKMFQAKAKLFTKENNAKPKHKSSIQSGDMPKLNRYFMEGANTDGVWKDAEELVEFIWFSLCFHFAHRSREGWRELTRQSFEIKTDDTGARYITEKLTEQTKITKDALNSLSSHTRMLVCTKLQLHLIQWLRLNFTSAKLIPTARHCFDINFASTRHWYRNEPMGKILSAR